MSSFRGCLSCRPAPKVGVVDSKFLYNIVKTIGFEEHYRLPVIDEVAKQRPHDPYMLMKTALTKSGMYKTDPQSGWPEGIYDLGAGRIAAMDAAGIVIAGRSGGRPLPQASVFEWPTRQATSDFWLSDGDPRPCAPWARPPSSRRRTPAAAGRGRPIGLGTSRRGRRPSRRAPS